MNGCALSWVGRPLVHLINGHLSASPARSSGQRAPHCYTN